MRPVSDGDHGAPTAATWDVVLRRYPSDFAEAEESLAVIIPWTEHLIETMEFVSLG